MNGRAITGWLRFTPNDRIKADEACQQLEVACRLLERVETDFKDDGLSFYSASARICEAASMEAHAALGDPDAAEIVAILIERVTEYNPDPASDTHGSDCESYGHLCVSGCRICLRHLPEGEEYRNSLWKLLDESWKFAEATGNWALRRDTFTIDFMEREMAAAIRLREERFVLDRSEFRVLVDLIGRYPQFREPGLTMLEIASAQLPGSPRIPEIPFGRRCRMELAAGWQPTSGWAAESSR